MKKRIFSFLTAFIICGCMLPFSVNADVAARTIVTYKSGALEASGSNYIVKADASVGASTFLHRSSMLIINQGATLYIKKGVTLEICGDVQIAQGGKLVVQEGATVIFNQEYGHTKMDGTLASNKGSSIVMKQGNLIVGKDGKISCNGELKPAKDAGNYTIAIAGELTKGKDGSITAEVIQNSAKNIVMPSFLTMPVIDADAKALRFKKNENIHIRNVEDLQKLQYLTSLEKLEFYNGYAQNLNMLKGLTKLKTLDLKYMQVEDISFLTGLKSLTTLRMSTYPTKQQISVLKKLKNLKTLDISIVFHESEVIPAAFKDLRKALPDTQIIYGDTIYTKQYGSFYAKVTYAQKYLRRFKLCDKNGNVTSDFEFCLRPVDHFFSSDEIERVTVEFNEQGKQASLTLKEGDVIKIYYDYRDTSKGLDSFGNSAVGLRVKEYAEKKPDYDVYVYAYRIDMISSAKK